MPRMPTLDILSKWLCAHGKTPHEIDRYAAHFARLKPLESTPCPQCYLEAPGAEAEQSLMRMDRQGQALPLFCPRCRTTYRIPVEHPPSSMGSNG